MIKTADTFFVKFWTLSFLIYYLLIQNQYAHSDLGETGDQSDIQHWAACQPWEEPSLHLPCLRHLSPAGTWFCKTHHFIVVPSQEISA